MTSLAVQSPREAQELVQKLVQDFNFISAVRDGALHSAAIAAVRLLKPHLGGSEFKRPPDRRAAFLEGDGLLDGSTPRHAVASPTAPASAAAAAALQRQLSPDPRQREVVRVMRQEALQLEDQIPWNSVRRTWRNKRSNWRRQVKAGELVPDMALRLKELRAALLTDDTPSFVGCGQAWRVQLDACVAGRGSQHSLVSVWEELKAAIRAWLDIRDKQPQPLPPATALQLHAGAVRAVQSLQQAAVGGGGGTEAAVLQVPLESILNHSRDALSAVQHAIDLERRVVATQAAAGASSGGAPPAPVCDQNGQPLVSYFSSIHAGWDGSEFDSGADSDCGSDATDMDSSWD